MLLTVSSPSVPSPLFTALYAPHMYSVFNLEQGVTLILIPFSSECAERCPAYHLASALCVSPQGLFVNLFDLWLWFVAVTDFFVVTTAATVSLQLDFEPSV